MRLRFFPHLHSFEIHHTFIINVFSYRLSICYPSRTAVVCPIIDVISDETFEYMAGSDMTYGGFNWKLNFRWYPVPQREMDRRKGDRTLPVRYRSTHVPTSRVMSEGSRGDLLSFLSAERNAQFPK